MRFVQFEVVSSGRRGLGVELTDGGNVVDIAAGDPSIPTNMKAFLEGGDVMITAAKTVVDSGSHVINRETLRLLAPITQPDKILCVCSNYMDHCEEVGCPVPEVPILFSKFSSTIVGPVDDVIFSAETEQMDWEAELAIVIGKAGKRIQESDAMNHVFGYTVANDVSDRDWQFNKNRGQFLIGKSMDTFCPLGPAIVMKEDLPDPHNLGIWCRLNGVTKQESNTSQLVHKSEAIIAFVSRFFTLLPGDVISTGTPAGVGYSRNEYIQRGDVVECEIDKIGRITNKFV